MKTTPLFTLISVFLFTIPAFSQVDEERFPELRKNFKADSIYNDSSMYLSVRSAKSHLWGEASEEGIFIPCLYDSVRSFDKGKSDFYYAWNSKGVALWRIENSNKPIYEAENMSIEVDAEGGLSLKAKKGGKWGEVNIESGTIIQPFQYDHVGDFKTGSWENYTAFGDPVKMLNMLNADKMFFDTLNQEGNFIARNSKTGKWGMYMSNQGNPKEMIPPNYDSICFNNGTMILVWQNHLAGVYINPFDVAVKKESVACKYESLQIMNGIPSGYMSVYAKQNGKWGVIDWYDGKTVIDFTYNSPDSIPADQVPMSEYYSHN